MLVNLQTRFSQNHYLRNDGHDQKNTGFIGLKIFCLYIFYNAKNTQKQAQKRLLALKVAQIC